MTHSQQHIERQQSQHYGWYDDPKNVRFPRTRREAGLSDGTCAEWEGKRDGSGAVIPVFVIVAAIVAAAIMFL